MADTYLWFVLVFLTQDTSLQLAVYRNMDDCQYAKQMAVNQTGWRKPSFACIPTKRGNW